MAFEKCVQLAFLMTFFRSHTDHVCLANVLNCNRFWSEQKCYQTNPMEEKPSPCNTQIASPICSAPLASSYYHHRIGQLYAWSWYFQKPCSITRSVQARKRKNRSRRPWFMSGLSQPCPWLKPTLDVMAPTAATTAPDRYEPTATDNSWRAIEHERMISGAWS